MEYGEITQILFVIANCLCFLLVMNPSNTLKQPTGAHTQTQYSLYVNSIYPHATKLNV